MDIETKNRIKQKLFGKEKIYIWGAGKLCEGFLESNVFLYEIIDGIIDNDPRKSQQVVYGKNVFHPSELHWNQEIFVIITSSYFIEITKQLEDMGLIKKREFEVYFKIKKLMERKLEMLLPDEKQKLQEAIFDMTKSENLDKVKEAIEGENCNTVSFLIENVLISSPVLRFQNLYYIVAKRAGLNEEFVELRHHMEIMIRNQGKKVTLEDVYERLAKILGISPAEGKRLLQLELEVYKQYAMVRNAGKALFEKARKENKQIILISNLIYPVEYIKDVLNEKGYSGYSEVFCVDKVKKEEMLQVLKVYNQEASLLHIGSRFLADYVIPSEAHIESRWFPSAIMVARNNEWLNRFIDNTHINSGNGYLLAYTLQKIFDNPYLDYKAESYYNEDLSCFSMLLLVPILLECVLWMLKDMQENCIKKLVLVYRDGYLIEKIINILKPYIKSDFEVDTIYLSRKIRYCIYAQEENGFLKGMQDLPVSETLSIENFVQNRLLTSSKEKKEVVQYVSEKLKKKKEDSIGGLCDYIELLPYFSEIYRKNATSKYFTLEKYCNTKIANPETTAIFDIGYRASVLRALHDYFGINCRGYHLYSKNYLDNGDYAWKNNKVFYSYSMKVIKDTLILHPLMEDIISIQEGTAEEIAEENGEFVVKKKNAYLSKEIDQIQKVILAECEKIVAIMQGDLIEFLFDHCLEMSLLIEFLSEPNCVDAKMLRKMSFLDSEFVSSGQNANIYETWYESKIW